MGTGVSDVGNLQGAHCAALHGGKVQSLLQSLLPLLLLLKL
jgi:hypothetical protein